MKHRVAVMDLGTNTFHLLIAEGDAESQHILYKITNPVKLGEGGINKGVIQSAPFERGITAMKQFNQELLKYNVTEVKAIATSALRSAANGVDFINQVRATTGIDIETINGDQEAEYIYRGVKASHCLSDQTSLIVDIGGGSVEFIVANNKCILWKRSFEIGAARLMDQFHQIDPIPSQSVDDLYNYLEEKLSALFTALDQYSVAELIGSSGAFETFAELTETANGNPFDINTVKNYTFNVDDFYEITDSLIKSSHMQRAANQSIAPVRVDMIVVSSLLTRFILKRSNIEAVVMTTYSLKEGVLASMLG